MIYNKISIDRGNLTCRIIEYRGSFLKHPSMFNHKAKDLKYFTVKTNRETYIQIVVYKIDNILE